MDSWSIMTPQQHEWARQYIGKTVRPQYGRPGTVRYYEVGARRQGVWLLLDNDQKAYRPFPARLRNAES